MGFYAEGDHKAKEHSWRETRATVQLRRLYDALYVCSFFILTPMVIYYESVFVIWLIKFVVAHFFVMCDLHHLHRTIYNMCTQKPPHDYSQQLYDKYRESFDEYITSTVRLMTLSIYCILNVAKKSSFPLCNLEQWGCDSFYILHIKGVVGLVWKWRFSFWKW